MRERLTNLEENKRDIYDVISCGAFGLTTKWLKKNRERSRYNLRCSRKFSLVINRVIVVSISRLHGEMKTRGVRVFLSKV